LSPLVQALPSSQVTPAALPPQGPEALGGVSLPLLHAHTKANITTKIRIMRSPLPALDATCRLQFAPDVATSQAMRGLLGSLVAMLVPTLLGLALAGPARAAAPTEASWRAQPTADGALALAQQAFDRKQWARGMNWLERAVRSPGAGPLHQAQLAKARTDLRWQLADAGMGQLLIRTRPTLALITIDGEPLLPVSAQWIVWLPAGSHAIEAALPPDYGVEASTASVIAGERSVVELTCPLVRQPVLLMRVVPQAEVWVDNVRIGSSSVGRLAVTPGSHLIELRAAGHQPDQRTLVFAAGETKELAVALRPLAVDVGTRPQASQIERELLPTELGQSVDPRPLDGASSRSTFDRGAGGANGPQFDRSSDTGRGVPTPTRAASLPPPAAEAPAVAAAMPEAPATPSAPWARSTKGALWLTTGLAAAGAGAAWAWLGAQAAQEANDDPTTRKKPEEFQAAYDAGKQQVQVGYAAMGIGALGVGLGGWYLYSQGGLSRTGKGVLTASLGAAAAGAGVWLMTQALAAADAANALEMPNADYARQYDDATAMWRGGLGLAVAGGAALAGGVVWAASGGGSQTSSAPATGRPTELAWQWSPTAAGRPGASLSLTW
jgi:hypothetical protein